MSELGQEDRAILDKQVADWMQELRHLASQLRPPRAPTALSF
jgi:hypothetical protein